MDLKAATADPAKEAEAAMSDGNTESEEREYRSEAIVGVATNEIEGRRLASLYKMLVIEGFRLGSSDDGEDRKSVV